MAAPLFLKSNKGGGNPDVNEWINKVLRKRKFWHYKHGRGFSEISQSQKNMLYHSTYMRYLEQSVRKAGQKGVCQELVGMRRNWEIFNVCAVSVLQEESSGDGCRTVNILNTAELYTWKWGDSKLCVLLQLKFKKIGTAICLFSTNFSEFIPFLETYYSRCVEVLRTCWQYKETDS